MFAANELGVFDVLAAAPASGLTLSDLAARLTADPASLPAPSPTGADETPPGIASDAAASGVSTAGLEQLLHACVALELLQRHPTGCFTLSPVAAAYLVRSAPNSLTGYVVHSSKVSYPLFGCLEHSVRTGAPSWERLGYKDANPFTHIYRSPEDRLRFMEGMHSYSRFSAAAVASAFDLSAFRSAVDLGGATGALAVALCARYPGMSACVVDMPAVIEAAQRHFLVPPHCTAPPEVVQRVTWLAADFFTQVERLPAGDLFIVSRILHDWDATRIATLLASVHARLPSGGALLVCEMLLDGDDGCGPTSAALLSLTMLVQTLGKERSLAEYRTLLEAAGFVRVEGRRTGKYLDAVLAFKD